MKTHASFSFEGDAGAEQAGPLAAFFIAALGQRGFACTEAENLDYAFAFNCAIDKRNFYLLLGYVNDEGRDWLLSTNSDIGVFRRLTGARDTGQYAALVTALHEIMVADGRFGHVRWYTLEEWNENPDTRFSLTPI